MKAIDPVIVSSISELFINLSAGWFAAAFISPNFSRKKKAEKLYYLTLNVIFATVCLIIAIYLKKLK